MKEKDDSYSLLESAEVVCFTTQAGDLGSEEPFLLDEDGYHCHELP